MASNKNKGWGFYMKMHALTLFALYSLFILYGCEKQPPVNVALHDWPSYQFPLIAQQDEPSRFNDFNVIKTKNATETIELLKQESVMAAYLTLDEVLLARDKGIPLSILLVANISAGADVVIANRPIKDAKDIIGKTIAYEASALGNFMLQAFLEKYQVKKHDMILLDSPYDKHQHLFNKSAVDFIVTYYPTAQKIINGGGINVFSSAEMPNTIIDVLAVNEQTIKTQKDSICNLVTAHFYGVESFYKNPADIEFRLASLIKVSHPTLVESISKVTIPNFAVNKKMMTLNNETMASAKHIHKLMQQEQMISANSSLNGLINNECVNDLFEQQL